MADVLWSPPEADHMSVPQLLQACQACCASFNPAQLSLDAHADAFLAEQKISAESDGPFIRQVLYGTVRYQALLKIVVESFYRKNSGSIHRSDAQLYTVLAYLAIMRLTELGPEQYRRVVGSPDPQKVVTLLAFLTDTDTLVDCCRDEWLKLYDKEFVDDLLATLASFRPELQEMQQQLQGQLQLSAQASRAEAAKFSSGAKGSTGSHKQTVPEPFSLTQPKPKLLPIEEPLPAPMKWQPAPPPHQGPTREERAIEAAKQRNRQEQLQRFSDPAHGSFHLLTAQRPTNTQQLKQQQEEELRKQVTGHPGKARPAPGPPAAHVRLNAAAILREDNLYKKKQLQEAQMIKRCHQPLASSTAMTLAPCQLDPGFGLAAPDAAVQLTQQQQQQQPVQPGPNFFISST